MNIGLHCICIGSLQESEGKVQQAIALRIVGTASTQLQDLCLLWDPMAHRVVATKPTQADTYPFNGRFDKVDIGCGRLQVEGKIKADGSPIDHVEFLVDFPLKMSWAHVSLKSHNKSHPPTRKADGNTAYNTQSSKPSKKLQSCPKDCLTCTPNRLFRKSLTL